MSNRKYHKWQTLYFRLIYHLQLVSTLHYDAILPHYRNRRIDFTDRFYKNHHYKLVQIEFRSEKGKIELVFDKEKSFIYANLYPDFEIPVSNYTNLLYTYYKYDRLEERWLLPDGYLYLMELPGENYFKFELIKR